jgi:glycosyltransferase involved in cell wall biosynthesis
VLDSLRATAGDAPIEIIAGTLDEAGMDALWQQCDCLLSLHRSEGFGLPVIEGFQAGRPVITSNISPMKEVAGDGALLADPSSIASIRDQVIKLLTDQQLQTQLVAKGKEKVKQYQPGFIAERYQELWSKFKN